MKKFLIVLAVFTMGCIPFYGPDELLDKYTQEMPEKLPGEDILLYNSPNWKYFVMLKIAMASWGVDVHLEPRIFKQEGMKNVVYFIGNNCRAISSYPMPLNYCVDALKGAGGHCHKEITTVYIDSTDTWVNVEQGESWRQAFEQRGVDFDPDLYTEGIMVHELGHFLGMNHSKDMNNPMNPDIAMSMVTKMIFPTEGDRELIDNVYNKFSPEFIGGERIDNKHKELPILYVMM